MSLELTQDAELQTGISNITIKTATTSKRYTDQEAQKVRDDLKAEFKSLTGTNKETIDSVVSLLDKADLNDDGSLDIVKFHQDLVAKVATNEANTKTTGDLVAGVIEDIKQAVLAVADVKALALSNQRAIKAVGAGFAQIASDIYVVFGFIGTNTANAL